MLGQVLSYDNIRDIIKFCKEEKLVLLADEVDMLNKCLFAELVDNVYVLLSCVLGRLFSQMGVQVPIFHMSPYKLLIWADPIAHFGWPLFVAYFEETSFTDNCPLDKSPLVEQAL